MGVEGPHSPAEELRRDLHQPECRKVGGDTGGQGHGSSPDRANELLYTGALVAFFAVVTEYHSQLLESTFVEEAPRTIECAT
ncbi:hypothetical protein GCM10010213_32740 [Microbacterium maritypicum]|nr:hypothetical protein GCM10010213_32740 [Microbacterium liquefaciens]